MLLYFLRIIQYFLIKFCTVVLGITLMVTKFKQCSLPSAGDYFGVFWSLFWHMYIFFSIFVQYFLTKFCTGVLGMTLIIISTLQGTFWGILGPIMAYYVYFFTSTDVFGVPIWDHYTNFSTSWPCWGALEGIFGLILGNVPLIRHNCLIFSHETLCRCS